MNRARAITPNVPATLDRHYQSVGLSCADASRESNRQKDAMASAMSECIANVMKCYADQIALAAPSHEHLTYASLFEQITGTVDALNNLGIGRGDRVALVLPDGLVMAAAFLGISAGSICTPLNPRYREQEFAALFCELHPKALITEAGIRSDALSAAREQSIPTIELAVHKNASGTFTLESEKIAPAPKCGFAEANDTALLLFTSGTTARPKLVPLTHANLLASARHIASSLRLTPADRCLNVMPLFHIHGLVGGLLASLVSGGSVVCPSGLLVENFVEWLKQFRPSWYTAVPTMHQAIVAQTEKYAGSIKKYPLRFIRSCSAPLPTPVTARLEAAFQTPVIEAYGMTEAAHQIASNPLPAAERKQGSVGRATGLEMAIVDEAGNRQSAGAIGEVVIRGANVMRGYVSPDGANEQAFLNGWFRTGDQGYLDGDEYLFLTGRIKDLINRGGEKISPREIEDVLMAHPAVHEAVVFPVCHPTLGEDVAAAVVLRPGKTAEAEELKQFAATKLADFKVPRQLLIVDEIPKSPTGKIQRGTLAKKFAAQLKSAFVAPGSELERTLTRTIVEVLGIEHVGATDNFFALGGDSLRAFQVLARIRTDLDVNLSIATLFRKATVMELAGEVLRVLAETGSDFRKVESIG